MTLYCPTCTSDDIQTYKKLNDDLLLVCHSMGRVYGLLAFRCERCKAQWFAVNNDSDDEKLNAAMESENIDIERRKAEVQ